MPMKDESRMAALQAKGAGAPPAEPPMAPPMAGGGDEMGGPEGGMPPPEVAIPKIGEVLSMMAEGLPDAQKSIVMECAEKLKGAFASNPGESAGMSPEDASAYGEA